MGRLKTVANNVMLYVGLIGYTAIGAKVSSVGRLTPEQRKDEWKIFYLIDRSFNGWSYPVSWNVWRQIRPYC